MGKREGREGMTRMRERERVRRREERKSGKGRRGMMTKVGGGGEERRGGERGGGVLLWRPLALVVRPAAGTWGALS